MPGKITHGHTIGGHHSPTFKSWESMMARCYTPGNHSFPRYGARGISVCARWLGKAGFQNFLADMGERPKGMTLDRIDNDGHYEPGNCRWATAQQQQQNKRGNRLLTCGGRTQCLRAWARELGLSPQLIRGRLKAGWAVERALTTRPA